MNSNDDFLSEPMRVEPEVLRMEQTLTTSATPLTAVIAGNGLGLGRVRGLLAMLAAMQAASAFAVSPGDADDLGSMDFTRDPWPEPVTTYDVAGKRKAQWKNERNGRRFKR